MVRRQMRAGGLGLSELLRVGASQAQIQTRNFFGEECGEVFRGRDGLFRHEVILADRLFQDGPQSAGEPLVVVDRGGRGGAGGRRRARGGGGRGRRGGEARDG